MNVSATRVSTVSKWLFAGVMGVALQLSAQTPVKFDSATISGLPARNIGSATMSGRVAAVDAVTIRTAG